jgi:hypothetical protein
MLKHECSDTHDSGDFDVPPGGAQLIVYGNQLMEQSM